MNRKRIIFSSLCVILLIALVGGTVAWFYINEDVTISYGNSIFCEAGDSLEIALVEDGKPNRWGSSIDYSNGNFTTVDISGNGEALYRPAEIDENQKPLNMKPAVSSLAGEKSYDFIEMEVAFRSVSKMNVYLSEESFMAPVNKENTTSNIYGDFSRDYIAGAMRVAVLDEQNNLKLLWAPNATYHLIQNGNGTYAFNPNGVPETDYSFFAENENGEIVQYEVPSDYYANKRFVADSTGAKSGDTGHSPILVSLVPEEGKTAEAKVKIRIWFEGCDREAHQALAGGNVNAKLKFIGIAKETNEAKQAEIDAITFDNNNFSGLKEGMVFSTDGRSWTSTVPVLEAGDCVYIKYPETDTHYETICKKFTKN